MNYEDRYPRRGDPTPEPARPSATSKQIHYIKGLLETRVLSPEQLGAARAQLDSLTKVAAMRWIERLRSFPMRTSVGSDAAYATIRHEADGTGVIDVHCEGSVVSILAGRYAVSTPHRTNETSFYHLWVGDRAWRLTMLVSDDRIELSRDHVREALASIALDPLGAAARYGQSIGKCGVCNRTLTNDESRARGIGPVCAVRME